MIQLQEKDAFQLLKPDLDSNANALVVQDPSWQFFVQTVLRMPSCGWRVRRNPLELIKLPNFSKSTSLKFPEERNAEMSSSKKYLFSKDSNLYIKYLFNFSYIISSNRISCRCSQNGSSFFLCNHFV